MATGSVTDARAQSQTFELQGAGAYNAEEILSFAAQLELTRTGTVTASGIARTIETLYREDGYFLAEASVGRDGKTIFIDEGEIGSVSIEGVDQKTFDLISGYFRPVVGKQGVTLAEFERAVMLTEDIQSVTASAEIYYPDGQDGAHVRVVAEQQDTASGYVTLDNPAREFGDAVRLTFSQEFISLLAPGDLFRFELSGTAAFDGDENDLYGSVIYRAPVGYAGTYGEIYLGNAVGDRDATGNLRQTDLDGDTVILAIGHPFVRSIDTYGYGLLEVRRSSSDSDVDGIPTDFESTVNVIGASWIYGRALQTGGAFEYATNLAFGSRTSGADGFDDGDEDFWHLRAGAGYEQPVRWFGENSSFRTEIWGQYTTSRLPGIEEFYLGGIDEERGYTFAEVQGDSGVSAVFQAGRDFFPQSNTVRRYRPFGFVDVGYVDNNDPSAEETDNEFLSSVGLGVDLEFENRFFAQAYVAVPTTSGPETDSGDPAFYLALSKSW
ncbi:ShlB/FhaC/HecB family hemolysin secretion/activation protein [Roseobacter ponti]|uniref:ShlB/FhaC/HecB family hemolysin secretion/activation protein n=1 Tax=Roseobacter ponti TaxID=1891787 RepID=A0A858SRK5_9RHOB|nr:ShlB/FhaC/HecB family hemolysin secretion/activation protein [Roseobacter ponti]QJF50251.1 ShlB/FhaC/HecB family hemolysin secretion/activation protein [Roseobacter ponti]